MHCVGCEGEFVSSKIDDIYIYICKNSSSRVLDNIISEDNCI